MIHHHNVRRTLACAAVLLLAVALSRPAHAADPVAESMFQQGLSMLKEGKFEEACRALDASHKLEPRSGTLAVLGTCHEQLGRTATAWAEYKEAAALARSEGRINHADKATELAKALEPKLSMLRIDAQLLQGGVTMVVKLNGTSVVDGSLGVAFAVDPGQHEVTASAEGRRDWRMAVNVGPNGDRKIIAIPELELLTAPQTPVANPEAPAPVLPPTPLILPVVEPEAPVWPWIVGGLGVAMLGGAGAGLGVSRAAAGTLDDRCGTERLTCDPGYDFDNERSSEIAGFGVFVGLGVAGIAALTTGIIGLALPGEGPSPVEAGLALDGERAFGALSIRF